MVVCFCYYYLNPREKQEVKIPNWGEVMEGGWDVCQDVKNRMAAFPSCTLGFKLSVGRERHRDAKKHQMCWKYTA